jgi:hypothetical protein
MITDEIQELLDGGLGDERTAELLHTLSVSPEKRTAFREYLGLHAAMQQDRLASTLTASEDTAMWGAITGSATVPTAAASAMRRTWLARGAALLAAGTIGYLLGTTTIFAPTETIEPTPRGRAAQHVDAPRSRFQSPTSSTAQAPAVIAAAPRVEYRDRIEYRDRVVYRDRIVYRDRDLGQADATSNVSLSMDAATNTSSNGTPNVEVPLTTSPTTPPASTSLQSVTSPTPTIIAPPPALTDSATKGSSNATAANATPANLRGDDESFIAASMEQTPSPFDQGGWSANYTERIGLLAPAPQKIEKEDPGFSYRMLGLTYWFDGGRFGVGGRAGYGSFATVELERQASSTGLGPEISGTVKSSDRIWMEAMASWRLPLSNSLALAVEAVVGGSTHHTKVSGDLVATYFVTDFLALQGGAGLGRYWYTVAAERDRLLEDVATGGVTSDTRTDYEGVMFEGRYGLLVRF